MNERICKHCGCKFDLDQFVHGWFANHVRWCKKNPIRHSYKGSKAAVEAMNAKKKETGFTNQFTKAKLLGLEVPEGPSKGKKTKGTPHTEETKNILRIKALASKHRRLVKSTRKYKRKDGTFVLLDSSWEEELAKRLDFLDIYWIRPDPIEWLDETGIKHNYFPDFYLPDFDLFLDPKNRIAMQTQQEKIKILKKQLNNLLFLETLEECKNFVV